MSHREKGLTPWIRNNPGPRPAKYRDFTVEQINAEAQRPDISDEDKHAICMIRTGHQCAVLSPSMYDAAVRQGCDMSSFVKNKPMPFAPSTNPRWPCRGERKNRDSVSCHDCMPGLGGRCTCCPDQE